MALSEYESQMSVNDLRSHILGNISGTWLQTSIKEELAASLGRWASDIPPTASQTVTTNFIYNDTTNSSCPF